MKFEIEKRIIEKLRFELLVCLLFINFFGFCVHSAEIPKLRAKVAFQGETFNFEISGQKSWDYDLKRIKEKNQTKIQLSLKDVEIYGLEEPKILENPFIKSIVAKKDGNGKVLVEFILKKNDVETFDYLTDQPTNLVIDFYQSEAVAPRVSEANYKVKANSEINKKLKKNAKSAKLQSESSDIDSDDKDALLSRRPADVDVLRTDDTGELAASFISKSGLYDGGDTQFSRFSMREDEFKDDAVIRSQSNYYLKFPNLESEFHFWKRMQQNPPMYEFKEKNDQENKQARLLKTLFDKKRFLVFLKTSDWFKEKFPESTYRDVIDFMVGDALNQLSVTEKSPALYEQGQAAYTAALKRFPSSPLAERTSLLLGLMAYEKMDYMTAIRHLTNHSENQKYKGKISQDYAKIALAYSFSKLNRTEDATKVISELEKISKDPLVLAACAVSYGDFYLNGKDYQKAIQFYELAIKNHPLVGSMFPSAFFNRMEAQFWTKNFKDSHRSALEFARIFPSHSFAPYALTRLGELLEIMGADQAKSVGAFLETHFRYGDDPKTIVARLHLLSTRMKSMKSEELAETLKRMDALAEKSDLSNVDQFKTVMVADGFSRRQEFPKAVEILSNFYQQFPTRPDSKQVTQRILRNIYDELKFLADHEKYREVLKTYKSYADNWLKGQTRIDTDYVLGLAYENAGANEEAITKFKRVSQGLLRIAGTSQEREVRVNEYLPTMDELNLKLAMNLYENNDFQESYRAIEKIQSPLSLSEPQQIERIILASKLYEKKGDQATAIRYLSELSRLWGGSSDLVLPVFLRLAELQRKQNGTNEAITALRKSVEIIMKMEKPDGRTIKQVGRDYLSLLLKDKKNEEAIAMLEPLVQKFDGQQDMSEEKFQLGMLLFKRGELKKAEQVWQGIENSEGNIWKKLAQEKLQQANWDENYKKHLKRIPAMSQMEGLK